MAIAPSLALFFALTSGLIERMAHTDPEGTFVRWATGVAAKLFTLSVVFILFCGIQWQRQKMTARMNKLEQELSLLKAVR